MVYNDICSPLSASFKHYSLKYIFLNPKTFQKDIQ